MISGAKEPHLTLLTVESLAHSHGTASETLLCLQAVVKAQEYEAKLSNLKQTAQKKEREESQRWEARLGVVQQIYASAQACLLPRPC